MPQQHAPGADALRAGRGDIIKPDHVEHRGPASTRKNGEAAGLPPHRGDEFCAAQRLQHLGEETLRSFGVARQGGDALNVVGAPSGSSASLTFFSFSPR